MNIYLIRHTEVYNPNKLCYGQSEIPLAENFTASFDWIQDSLGDFDQENNLYYSSPFRRCTKLAAYLSNDDFMIDNRISELNFGNWEMQAWNKIDPEELNRWMTDFVNVRLKAGESFTDLFNRVTAFYDEIIRSGKENIIIITHAGVIRSVLAYILDFPLENAFDLEISYSSITKIIYNPQFNKSKIHAVNLIQR